MIEAFDDLKCTFDGAFKQLFRLGLSGELEEFMPKQGGNVAFWFDQDINSLKLLVLFYLVKTP